MMAACSRILSVPSCIWNLPITTCMLGNVVYRMELCNRGVFNFGSVFKTIAEFRVSLQTYCPKKEYQFM